MQRTFQDWLSPLLKFRLRLLLASPSSTSCFARDSIRPHAPVSTSSAGFGAEFFQYARLIKSGGAPIKNILNDFGLLLVLIVVENEEQVQIH
jgi:hypothetical protein